jgi:hypothetical protein
MTQKIKVMIVVKILKERFPNVGALEILELSYKIVEALDEPT